MNSTLAKILRRTFFVALLLLAVLTFAVSIFLSQLDLDDYRHELEKELSSALEQPVRIGRSKLAFNKGIALRFQGLEIGPEGALLADIPFLTANLKIAPLFEGKVILDRVMVESPRLQVWLPMHNRPERGTAHDLTDKFGIRVLTVRDAELTIHHRTGTSTSKLLQLESLNAELHGWQPNQTTRLAISGQLLRAGQTAELNIDLTLPSSPDPQVWRHERFTHQFQVKNLSLNRKSNRLGNIDFTARMTGIPADGARIEANISSTANNKDFFKMAGHWKSTPEQEIINDLGGELFGIPLKGEFYLLHQEQEHFLSGRLGVRNVKLTPELLNQLHISDADKLRDGRLDRMALIVEKRWPVNESMQGMPKISAEFTITDLEWAANGLKKIQDFSAELSLDEQQLTIKDGILVAGAQPIFFSGQISDLFSSPQLILNAELNAGLADLDEYLELPDGWRLSGSLPAKLDLAGPLLDPRFQLTADFTNSAAKLGSLLEKSVSTSGHLLLAGRFDPEQIDLEQFELNLDGTVISGDGSFAYDPGSNYFLLDVDPIRLSTLQAFSPLLKKLRLTGTLHPQLTRENKVLTGQLELTRVGAHLNNIVGDLNNTSGVINIDNQGLSFENLQAGFGKSMLLLNGQLDSWESPRLDLTLAGRQVRAQDLIFPNRQLQFYNLDGHLQIDKSGINFKTVKVQLEKATEVTVTGKLDSFSNPQVTLDIGAEKANIDQVIELFVGPRKRAKAKPSKDARPVIITARVKEGTIGGLKFKNAEGLIKDHRNVFTLYPLRFLSGEGFCLARVEFDRNEEGGLLKISGHAENINATVLHQDLFKDRGLINGSLRSNFYLEGSLSSKTFWHNAVGGIHLQVTDGTLRKFRGLARVFSLLNVSQLFKGKLPDMDKEGMPFSLLEGSIQISGGRAKTDGLKIISEAMNMSLVGSQSLIDDNIDFNLGVMPLRTVDKVITSIPVAGWILTGEDKALFTAHFKVEGSGKSPKVTAVPINTVSDTVFGIFKRTFGLPGKLAEDIGSVFKKEEKKKEEQ